MASLWEACYGRKPRLFLSVVLGVALTAGLAWADFNIRGASFSTGYLLPLVLLAQVRRPWFIAAAAALLLVLCGAACLSAAQAHHELMPPTALRYPIINRGLSAAALVATWSAIALASRWQLKGKRPLTGNSTAVVPLGGLPPPAWLAVCLVLTASTAVCDMVCTANLNLATLYVVPILLCFWTQRKPETIWALVLLVFVLIRLEDEMVPSSMAAITVPDLLANRLLVRVAILSIVVFAKKAVRPAPLPPMGLMPYGDGGLGKLNERQAYIDRATNNDPAPGRRRRIAFIDHTASLGGGEIALLNLLRHLDRRQYDPLVIVGSRGPLVEALRRAGVETHVLPLASDVVETRKGSLNASGMFRVGTVVSSLDYVLRLTRFLRRSKISLVHTNSLKADVLGGLAGRLAGRPVLWHVRDRIADDYIPRRAAQAFRVACCVLADYVAANSDHTLALLRPAYADIFGEPAARRRMRAIHDGVTWEAFVLPTHAFGDHPRVGLVGRISPFKGQEIFVRAAALVHQRFPEARFYIIGAALFGEHEYERMVHELVESLGLNDVVMFTGFRPDVTRAISELDLLVHASITGEPFGQVIVEGMAASKPVIATHGGGVPEIVVDGVTGLLVPMGETGPMAAAICNLLSNPELAARMGQAGLQRVRSHFLIENTAAKVEAFYQAIFRQGAERIQWPWREPVGQKVSAVLICIWLMIAIEFLSAFIRYVATV